jgi:putative ABC transport system ATP-binding protein
MPLIALENVTRTYQLGVTTVRALRGIDLSIEAGEFVALWGPSGSGKSTLCHLMGLVDIPTTGRVQINGRDAVGLSDDLRSEHRNRSVGFIFQQFNLLPVLSALENVMLPLSIRGAGGNAMRRDAAAILGEVGLGDCLHQRPDQLSGGQRQRVAIARALVTTPPVVIADEPTANLDSENARRIVDLMRTLQSSRGTTFLFATHDQRLLERVSRRIRLEDGVIREDVRNPDVPAAGLATRPDLRVIRTPDASQSSALHGERSPHAGCNHMEGRAPASPPACGLAPAAAADCAAAPADGRAPC